MTSTFCTAIWVAQRPPREHRREVRHIWIVDKENGMSTIKVG